MGVQFDFGSRKKPLGNWEIDSWEKLKPCWKQVAGTRLVEVKVSQEECGEADALWTRKSGIPIGVLTADCVPLLLYREDQKGIAAIHAGWQGTLLRIVPKFFEALPSDLNQPSDWSVKLGPSIRACCYEFGEDLLTRFYSEFKSMDQNLMVPKPRHLDLIAILSHELRVFGAKIDSIDPRCTFCSRESDNELTHYSYRRGDRKSRQYSIVMK